FEPEVFEARMEPTAETLPVMAEAEAEVVLEYDAPAMDAEPSPVRQEQPVVELGNMGAPSSAEHIEQVLSRLELINLELKLHLDNIDSRVSRLEPHIEELASQVVRTLGMAS